jgi:hypothetical protein
MRNFFIKGCQELKNVDFEDFVILQLAIGFVLQFCHDVKKNGVLISCISLLIVISLLLIA